MKQLILCADDYAQNEAISTGICELFKAERINATSCLTNMPLWPQLGHSLTLLTKGFVGLHLNFTFGRALSREWVFKPLSSLMLKAYLHQLHFDVVYAEMLAQLEAFRQVVGRNPDFIDGHQHVHQFPILQEALLRLIKQEQLSCFIRVSAHHQGMSRHTLCASKVWMMACLGGKRLRLALKKQNIPCNTSFSGVYAFKQAAQYAQFFKSFLQESEHNGLIMCHPGKASQDKEDPIAYARSYEFNYLMSEAFLSDLNLAGCELKNA